MDEIRYKARRDGGGFRIEDTRSGVLLEGEEYEDFFVANQAATDRERAEWADELARKVEEAGWPELAADVRKGVPRDVLLRRLREIGEGDSDAAQIIAEAPAAPQ